MGGGGSGGEEEGGEGIVEKASGGGTWRTCGVGGCVFRTKRNQDLKNHKAAIHCVDIVWHHCSELGCEYRAKKKEA